MEENHWYICGFQLDAPPWSTQWIYEYCPCCSCQFGYNDASIKAIAAYRINWIDSGTPWFQPARRPNDWSFEEQLAMIPKELPPDILQNE